MSKQLYEKYMTQLNYARASRELHDTVLLRLAGAAGGLVDAPNDVVEAIVFLGPPSYGVTWQAYSANEKVEEKAVAFKKVVDWLETSLGTKLVFEEWDAGLDLYDQSTERMRRQINAHSDRFDLGATLIMEFRYPVQDECRTVDTGQVETKPVVRKQCVPNGLGGTAHQVLGITNVVLDEAALA